MVVIGGRTTYDCEPTLDDAQVLEFCKAGYLRLDAVIPEAVGQRAQAFLNAKAAELEGREILGHDGPSNVDPVELLGEEWFVDGVLLHPAVAGAVRSLLGPAFGLPVLIHNHRVVPEQGASAAQGWHHDGGSQFAVSAGYGSTTVPGLNYLQVFYYPQLVTAEMGPTELVPGSGYFQLPGPPLGSQPLLTTASAGTVFITDYPIMHRRAASSRPCKRDLLKYMYWRTQPPARDWASTRDSFDFHKADWRSFYGAGGPMENVEAVSRRT
jgi:hypothetical protein